MDDGDDLEHERRRIAARLRDEVANPLTQLLTQSAAYDHVLAGNPSARTALAMLATLARQALQQTRDLAEALHPAVLDDLGLDAALDALAAQIMRTSSLRVEIAIERLIERPPASIERLLFRTAQSALERSAFEARATVADLHLQHDGELLTVRIGDDGAHYLRVPFVSTLRRRIALLGGSVTVTRGPRGGALLSAQLPLIAPTPLTPREQDVLRLVADGRTNKQIAAVLHITPRTVGFHLDHVYAKLGVASRTEAALYAFRYLSE